MNARYLVVAAFRDAPHRGEWYSGSTASEAVAKLQRLGRFSAVRLHIFKSPLPFAPNDRPAEPGEADAYVTADGTLCWTPECERTAADLRGPGRLTAATLAAAARRYDPAPLQEPLI